MNDTIIIPTDFTPLAANAAKYALHLADALELPVVFCNALKGGGEEKLTKWAAQVSVGIDVPFTAKTDTINKIIEDLLSGGQNPLIVTGMPGTHYTHLPTNGLDLTEKVDFPVLLVPADAVYKPVKQIAFATDLNAAEIKMIGPLAHIAMALDAEVQVSHVKNEKFMDQEVKERIDTLFARITQKLGYDKIYYRAVKSIDVNHGLDWLAEHSQVQMLAIAHHHHPHLGFINKIFGHTERVVAHTRVPVMILPADNHSFAL